MRLMDVVQFVAFLLVTGYALYLFGYVVASRVAFIRLGRKSEIVPDYRERFRQIAVNMFGHQTLLKDRRSGLMHLVLFYGFIVLQFGAIDLIGKGLVSGWHLPFGSMYRYFVLVQEITVLLVLAATGYAFYRRYVEKLTRLKRGWRSGIVIMLLSGLMVTIVSGQGFEMIWQERELTGLQPAGSVVAWSFAFVGAGAGKALFYVSWWLHLLVLLTFLVYIPQSKHAHLLFAPVNVFLRKLGAPGKLRKIDFSDETVEEYGVGRVEAFESKQLIDLYACVECGRCTSVCPASSTGKMLSPMDLIVKMRDHLTEKGAAVTSRTPWMPDFAFAGTKGNVVAASARAVKAGGRAANVVVDAVNLVGDVITEQELWACTTCRNCEDACPVANEHVDKIIDMRRWLVMTEGKVPAEAARALNNIERQGNPWGLSRKDRPKWIDGLGEGVEVPLVEDRPDFDYLLHVGSMGSYDARSMQITRAFVELMNRAGIRFAVLGERERNSGDTARRLGNEYLYEQLAEEYVEVLKKYKVKRIVTIDPHAYHTFKNEYRDFGLPEHVEVYHHSELLSKWVREGKLERAVYGHMGGQKLETQGTESDKVSDEKQVISRDEKNDTGNAVVSGNPLLPANPRIVFHDPCYLGRHSGVYDDPRTVLSAVVGAEIVEMSRSRSNSMCCGAGGGLMWLEEREGKRVNVARTEQALAVQPDIIATACPYCMTMMSDGVKAIGTEDRVRTLDIAELLAESIR